jgi:hypothetical protein
MEQKTATTTLARLASSMINTQITLFKDKTVFLGGNLVTNNQIKLYLKFFDATYGSQKYAEYRIYEEVKKLNEFGVTPNLLGRVATYRILMDMNMNMNMPPPLAEAAPLNNGNGGNADMPPPLAESAPLNNGNGNADMPPPLAE